MTTAGVLLIASIVAPLLAAALLLLPVRWPAFLAVGITAASAGWMLADRHETGAGPIRPWHQVDLPWIPELGVRFQLGVDGISWPLLALTVVLAACCIAWLWREPNTAANRRLMALVFVMQAASAGVFLALDLIVFVIFFELTLLPMYAMIAGWGGSARQQAARKFVLYTVAGSALLIIGSLWLVVAAGTSDLVLLAEQHHLSSGTQLAIFVVVALAFAVKAPLWPLHTWLPDAHTQAPTVGSVLLAGVLLKLGTYGLLRVAFTTLPAGAKRAAGVIAVLAVLAIVIGALVCLALDELKRLIAYSSVGHMGFVVLGLATANEIGLQAAQLGNIAHGLITGLLFFCVGAVKDRTQTESLAELGGLRWRSPRLAGLLGFAAVASFGLPGLAGFWGEAFAITAAASNATVAWWIVASVAAIGAAIVVAYFLRMLRLVVARESAAPDPLPNLRFSEFVAVAPLVIGVLLLGMWPGGITTLTGEPIARVVAVVTS